MSGVLLFMSRRLGAAAITILIAITVAFALAHLTGDPVRQMLGPDATAAQVAAEQSRLGLDRPLPERYGDFLLSTVKGDLGESIQYKESNLSLLGSRIGYSLQLVLAGIVLGVLIGFPLGLLAAMKRDSIWDRISVGVSLVGQSVPPFWLGLMLILVFAVTLNWLPAGQAGGIQNLILPAIAMATIPLAQVARITRSAAIEVMAQDYVVAARARGFSTSRVLIRHVIRGTALPVITVLGLLAGLLLSGAVTVEFVFGWPGLGSLIANAVTARDFTLIQAFVVLGAVTFVLINLAVDLMYSIIDPRVRAS